MKEHPILFQDRLVRAIIGDYKTETRRVGPNAKRWLKAEVGVILWVRESCFRQNGAEDKHGMFTDGWAYRADMGPTMVDYVKQCGAKAVPSIHMPRTRARLRLELTETPHIEPLQNITEDGARAEGVEASGNGWLGPNLITQPINQSPRLGITICEERKLYSTAREAFMHLWDSINAKRGLSFDVNPEVVVLRFKRRVNA